MIPSLRLFFGRGASSYLALQVYGNLRPKQVKSIVLYGDKTQALRLRNLKIKDARKVSTPESGGFEPCVQGNNRPQRFEGVGSKRQ